jgi:hypothetical protein
MSLKDTWIDKANTTTGLDGDDILAEDINAIANEVIEQGEKLDKIIGGDEGKGLSANDFTDEYKQQLDELPDELDEKVDKEEGKGLSTNDFNDEQCAKVDGLLGGYRIDLNPQFKETFVFNDSVEGYDTTLTNEALKRKMFKIKVNVYSNSKKVYEREVRQRGDIIGLRVYMDGSDTSYYFEILDGYAWLDFEIFDFEMENLGISSYDNIEVYVEGLYEESKEVPLDGKYIKEGTIPFYAFNEWFTDNLYRKLKEGGYLPFVKFFCTGIDTKYPNIADLRAHFELGAGAALAHDGAHIYYDLIINGEAVEGVSETAKKTADGYEVIIGESTDYAMVAQFSSSTSMLKFNFIDGKDYSIEANEMSVIVPIAHEFLGLSRREKIATENFVKEYVDENSGSISGEFEMDYEYVDGEIAKLKQYVDDTVGIVNDELETILAGGVD